MASADDITLFQVAGFISSVTIPCFPHPLEPGPPPLLSFRNAARKG